MMSISCNLYRHCIMRLLSFLQVSPRKMTNQESIGAVPRTHCTKLLAPSGTEWAVRMPLCSLQVLMASLRTGNSSCVLLQEFILTEEWCLNQDHAHYHGDNLVMRGMSLLP